jgi:hypothetical protein
VLINIRRNSVIVSTIQANQYSILVVSPDFVTSPEFDDNLTNLNTTASLHSGGEGPVQQFLGFSPFGDGYTGTTVETGFDVSTFLNFSNSLYTKSRIPGNFSTLDNVDCIKDYIGAFISGRSNLLVVVNTTASPLPPAQHAGNGSILAYMDSKNWNGDITAGGGAGWSGGAWICSANYNNSERIARSSLECDATSVLQKPDGWVIASEDPSHQYTVDHCLSEVTPETCQVQFIPFIMAAVIACNIVK